MDNNITIQRRIPSLDEFTSLRNSIGWLMPESIVAHNGLSNSLFAVCAMNNENQIVGCARVTGDGYMYFYISDMMVRMEYQRQGIGKRIMGEIMEYLNTEAPAGAFIGLFAAKGKEDFYRHFGFIGRPTDTLGQGMVIFKKFPEQ